MAIAAFWGKTIGYTDYYNSVYIEMDDGRAHVISRKLFEENYRQLSSDPFTAALNEDCIEYAVNDAMIPLEEQPEWYISAVMDGVIMGSCGMDMFYSEEGEEIPITPGSIIMRNYLGQLRYIEYEDFIKYYDMPRSEFIES